MKVFVAGATGVLGRALVPQLVARGHEVVGMTRSASKQDLVRSLGARPVVADALDPDAVAQAVASAEPEVIVHQLTALSGKMSIRDARHPDRSADGDHDQPAAYRGDGPSPGRRPRRGGTALRGAELRGVPMGPHGRAGADRGRSARSRPAGGAAAGRGGDPHLERAVTTIEWGEGLVLRYGGFYGPGTSISLAPDAPMAAPIRKRRFPIVGDGGGVWSHIHIDDAAAATAIAVERGEPGVYNIVDDEPAPVREWLPVLASALDAKPPRRIPRWLGRLAAGETATLMMTEARGASNAKAKRELGWQPRYASWRQGFAQGLG